MKKLFLNRVYRISMKGRQESITCLLILENENWFLGLLNPVDYVIDGIIIINKSHVRGVKRTATEIFTEKILKSKKIPILIKATKEWAQLMANEGKDKILFDKIRKLKSIIQVEKMDETICYVGQIRLVEDDNIELAALNAKFQWIKGMQRFQYKSIYTIGFNNDYTDSIASYLLHSKANVQ